MSDIQCQNCGQPRPSEELLCGNCGAELYPLEGRTGAKAEFSQSTPPPPEAIHPGEVISERYVSVNVIKYVRRPMNQWLAIGTDYYNFYFTDGELIVAHVHSGRLGCLGAIIGLPFYVIFFLITMMIGNWMDEQQGKSSCDRMENELNRILDNPTRYKVKTYDFGMRVALERTDACNSTKMKHKASIEGDEYYFDDFELDVAREKFGKHFYVIQSGTSESGA
jgi:hypothetical protein